MLNRALLLLLLLHTSRACKSLLRHRQRAAALGYSRQLMRAQGQLGCTLPLNSSRGSTSSSSSPVKVWVMLVTLRRLCMRL